jgi:hypothetical protein
MDRVTGNLQSNQKQTHLVPGRMSSPEQRSMAELVAPPALRRPRHVHPSCIARNVSKQTMKWIEMSCTRVRQSDRVIEGALLHEYVTHASRKFLTIDRIRNKSSVIRKAKNLVSHARGSSCLYITRRRHEVKCTL